MPTYSLDYAIAWQISGGLQDYLGGRVLGGYWRRIHYSIVHYIILCCIIVYYIIL